MRILYKHHAMYFHMPKYRTEINVHREELINRLNNQFLYKEMQR